MRIGSVLTSGVAFQKFDKVQQRVLVQKHIPQAIQIFLYDLNYPNPTTLHVEGTLVGSSASDLATKMQQLRSVCRERKPIWIDASDAYQGRLDFCKIQKLQGPIVDSTTSGLTATFIIDAQILPPWGLTHTNPWKQSGIYLRDLNNVGREYAINPLMNHCNFTLNESSEPYSFSWEFIVDNQNPFTVATTSQQASCDSLGSGTASATNPLAVKNTGLETAFDSVAIDTTNFKEGTGSLKATKTSPTGGIYYAFGYDFGASGMDVSSYDRIRAWYRCDQSGQSNYGLIVIDISGNWRLWYFALQGANTWMDVEESLASYSSQSSTAPDLTKIRYIAANVGVASTPPASINVWVDDIRLEVGYVNHCEGTNFWTATNGSSTTLSNDTKIYKEGSNSLKLSGTSDSNGHLAVQYAFPIANWNLTTGKDYDFLLLWVRADFGGNPTGSIWIQLLAPNTSNYFTWTYTTLTANQWYRLVVPLRNPGSSTGSASLTTVSDVKVHAIGTVSVASNLWVDEIAFDIGNWVNLESMVPDSVAQTGSTFFSGGYPKQTLLVQDWTGSAYSNLIWWDIYNSIWNEGNITFLDGSIGQYIYGNYIGMSTCNVGTVGSSTVQGLGNEAPSTFTMTYGTNVRMVFGIKLPPATSDSASGNYPSNDLTGYQAINKVRLKVQVCFTSDNTTYNGF